MTSPLNMRRSRTAFAIALFLIGQAFVTAHAIEHGNQPHEHNGIQCLAALNDGPKDLLPANEWVAPYLFLDESESLSFLNAAPVVSHFALKPPATGPPSI